MCDVPELPTRLSMMVIVMLPLAALLCARLVKSHSIQPIGGFIVIVVRVISVGEHEGAFAHTVVDWVNELHACAETVVADEPWKLERCIRKTISVGVMAEGQGMEDKSNSINIRLSPDPPED